MAKKSPDSEKDQNPQSAIENPRLFEVRLEPGHPTGGDRRAGLAFSAAAPTAVAVVPDAVLSDPWLLVTEIADDGGVS